jgi:TPP-dependent pyruvate/acetoin dehydrogenase alpha subunit
LPVVFVCENNVYGFSTHYRRVTPIENIADRAGAYGIPGVVVDGMNIIEVYDRAKEAIRRARQRGGPTLLECKTYRYMGHSRFEKAGYRKRDELDRWKERDPDRGRG